MAGTSPAMTDESLLPKHHCSVDENAQGSLHVEIQTMSRLTPLATLTILALLTAGSSAFSQTSDAKGANMRALGDRNTAPAKPDKAASGMKPCPEYGAGFYRLAGSDTCARISGGVASDVGVSGVRR
jgi:hypothetical protein